MNEMKRTGIFVAIAAVLTLITVITAPSVKPISPAGMVGKVLFPDFLDPLDATSLEVVKFNKETATANTFKVAKIDGSWVIPSHSDYPADAEDQLGNVAAEWIELKVLGVASDPDESGVEAANLQDMHKLYGVIDPLKGDTSDPEGVGTRVVMRDKNDKELVRLIIGKKVEERPGLCYVRVIDQDPVYTVKADTSKLSTKFGDWIEDDLLKASGWDIRRVDINDYSIDILQRSLTERERLSLEHNDTGDPRWKLLTASVYSQNGWTEQGLAENEELNTDTLNALKNAVDDLKIVDVYRKPEGLSESLKESGSINDDAEATSSLAQAGFYVVGIQDPNNPSRQYRDLRSNDGEISVTMKDGVRYVLRFGQIAGMDSSDEADAQAAEEKKEDNSSESKVNRYLFVMVDLDRTMIEQPKYEELPELPSEDPKPEEPKAEDAKTEEAKPTEEKAEEPKSEGDEAEEAKADEAKADEAKAEPEKADAEKPEEPKPSREEIEKQRAQIQKENDRKKEEYEEKLKEAEKRVKELNARFADWYYVIDNAEYKKIHLGRDKLVKEKEKEEEPKEGAEAPTPPAFPGMEPNSVGDFENLKLDPPVEK